jgi:hypothetical protein
LLVTGGYCEEEEEEGGGAHGLLREGDSVKRRLLTGESEK